MRYPILNRDKAQEILNLRRAGVDFETEEFVDQRGEGSESEDAFISELKVQLHAIKEKYPQELSSRDVEGGRFEAEACAVVHKIIPPSLGTALTDPDFWRYLSVMHFEDLVEWRHGSATLPAHLNNYGIGNTKRNLLFRMWMRAETSLDSTSIDPYHLARYGDKDLWESHIIGVRIGNARSTVRSLMKYLYPEDLRSKCRLKTIEVRALAKRITRLRANVLLEVYDDHQALSLISREAERAKLELAAKNA